MFLVLLLGKDGTVDVDLCDRLPITHSYLHKSSLLLVESQISVFGRGYREVYYHQL